MCQNLYIPTEESICMYRLRVQHYVVKYGAGNLNQDENWEKSTNLYSNAGINTVDDGISIRSMWQKWGSKQILVGHGAIFVLISTLTGEFIGSTNL